jgi:PAS domain S-box-containing protein
MAGLVTYGQGSSHSVRQYPVLPDTVARARSEIEQLLPRLRPACLETLRLLVSEVVTNAIRHGPRGSDAATIMRVDVVGDRVRVEIEDTGGGFSPPGPPKADGSGGWGLFLVDELADRWGIRDGPPTRVWFEVDACLIPERARPPGAWPEIHDTFVLEGVRAAVVATDVDGIVTRWNPQAEALFGWSPDEAVGSDLAALLFSDEAGAGSALFAKRLRTGGSWEGDWEARRNDGTIAVVHVAASPLHDEHGAPLGVVAAWFDIGDRKRVERELEKRVAELRESERNLRLITENSPIAILAYDLDENLHYVNQAVEELTGFSLEEIRERTYLDLVHPEDRKRVEERWRWLLAGGHIRDEEVRLITKGGAVKWSLSSWGPLLDEDGRRIGIQGRERDVTKRKRTELALQESEQRLRIALSAGGMGTWDWDIRKGRMGWSRELEKIHGLEPGTFGGTFEDSTREIHPEDRERVLESVQKAVTEGADHVLDYRIVRPDGVVRWVSARGQAFHDETGRAVRMAGVCSDVTERKETERRLAVQYAVSRVLAEASGVGEATPKLIEAVAEALAWELGNLWQVDEEAGVLRYAGGWCSQPSRAKAFLTKSREFLFTRGVGLPGRVWQTGASAWIPDVALDESFPRAPFAAQAGLHAAFAFPITLGDQVLGVVEFFSPRIREPDQALLETVAAIGRQIGQFLERELAEEAVTESEARKSAILESALEAIIMMREDGTIIEMNPAAVQMFGIDRDEAVGRELAGLIIPENLRARHREALERFRRTGYGHMLGKRLELSGLRADGTEFPIELTVTRVDLSGPALFTGYVRDITDRRRTEELRSRLLESERSARAEAEAARERAAYLAEASVILASSLDVRRTLTQVARLTVPRLADWCSVEMVEPDGSIRSVAVAHADPKKVALAREYRRRYPPDQSADSGIGSVIRTGRSELLEDIPDEVLQERLDPEQLEFARTLDVRSAMIVPLVAEGRSLGAISFASSESRRRFGQADLELAEDLAHRAAVAIVNARLYEERSHVARTLQRSLLPQRLPDIPGVEIAAFYQPAGLTKTEVGGDFYDAFEVGEGAWGIVIGDVCGKGVEAAAMTGVARHAIRAAAVHQVRPSSVLADLNEVLRREEGEGFCTVAMGRLVSHDRGATLTVSCGGHPLPVVLRRDGSVEAVGSPGTLVGIFEDVELQDATVELQRGDTVVFYTDGLIDTRRREPIDDAALDALLATCRDLEAMGTIECFRDAVADPEAESPDDIAILALRIVP